MKIFPILLIPALLMGCVKNPSQNNYNYNEVGQSVIVEFAQVVKVKEVDIQGRNTGTGASLGAAAGGAAGYQVGNGNGQLGGAIAGVLVGAVAGAAIEQAAANQKGYEYTVVTEHKEAKTIVQYQNPDDVVFNKGDRVMVQTKGTYQRVLPTDDLPTEIKRPKGIKVVD
jgi:outer membrane lipoprotein SlyB